MMVDEPKIVSFNVNGLGGNVNKKQKAVLNYLKNKKVDQYCFVTRNSHYI